MQNSIPTLTTILTDGMVVIRKGLDTGNIRVSKRPRRTIESIKNGTEKSRKILRAEKALDKMMAQGNLWASSEKSYQDTNPFYFEDENGKRLTGSQMRKLKKAGLITY
jgi:hypothetical protein